MINLPIYQPSTEPTIPEEIKPLLFDSDCPIIITFSGGKDSIAMERYLHELGIDKNRIELHHHLVDGGMANLWDWACTESYCEAYAEALDLPLVYSWAEGGITAEMFRKDRGRRDVVYQKNGLHLVKSQKGNSTRMKLSLIHI